MNSLATLKMKWDRTGRMREGWYPFVLTCAAAFVLWRWPLVPADEDLPKLLSAILSVAAIMAGFFATAKTILLSLSNEKTVQTLKRGGEYVRVVGYFWRAVQAQLFLAVYAALAFFVLSALHGDALRWWVFFLETLCVYAALTSYRALGLLSRLLRLVAKE